MRRRAQASSKRFTEQEFDRRWLSETDKLVDLDRAPKIKPSPQATTNFTIAAGYVALLGHDVLKMVRA
jgi:hypothetical protein